MADERLAKLQRVSTRHRDPAVKAWAKQQLATEYGDSALAEVQPGPYRGGFRGPTDLLDVEIERAAKQRQQRQAAAPKPGPDDARRRDMQKKRDLFLEMAGHGVALPPDAADQFLSTPEDIDKARNAQAAGLVGMAGGALAGAALAPVVGAASRAIPAVSSLFRIGGAAGAGAAGGAAEGGTGAALNDEDVGEGAATGAKWGAALGGGLSALGEAAGGVYRAIRGSAGKVGEDIRLLEQHGAAPSPMPFKPVKNAPSERMGVQPTSEGRGIVGERGARQMQEEVASQQKALGRRYRSEMDPAMASQGGREVSVEGLIAQIDQELASPYAQANKAAGQKLRNIRKMLEGKVEQAETFYPPRVSEGRATADAVEEVLERPMEIYNVRPQEVSTPRAAVFSQTPSDPVLRPRARRVGNNAGSNTVEGRAVSVDVEPTTIRSIEHGPAEGRATNVDVGDEVTIPMGDIRQRAGDGPNRYRTIEELNQIRQALDEFGDAEVAAAGGKIDKAKLPYARLADNIRNQLVAREAPAVAHTNRRHHAAKRKLEVTEERMRSTDNAETLGMQLASLGEEGSKVAGVRAERLGKLRSNFPVSEQFTREQLDNAMDAPRLLLAEERLAFKKLPRIGTGGQDYLNLGEPVVARGIYPAARATEGAANAGAKTLPVPLTLIDVEMERHRKKKAAKKPQPTKERP